MKCILFFFCAAWRRLQTFIHQFIPSFLTLYRVRVTTFWAQMWQIKVISVVSLQETQLKPICPYFLDITRKNSAQECCTLWALYLLLHYPKCFQGCWNPEKSTNFSRSEVKKSANETRAALTDRILRRDMGRSLPAEQQHVKPKTNKHIQQIK